MRFTVPFLTIAFLAAAQTPPPVRIILVGDSTMAVRSGYGSGFCALVSPEATCLNMAKGGRSTSSYRAEGSWDDVMAKLKDGSGVSTYVLIQFGHNDQPGKPGRSTDLATEFPANLRRYVDEVQAAGGKPVLVTPLTRRTFRKGQVVNTLGPWGDADKAIAAEEHIPVLDLNTESLAAVQKMGPAEANTLAMGPPPAEIAARAADADSPNAPKAERPGEPAPLFDYTHVGPKGADFFGRMVARELVEAVPELKAYFRLQ